MAYKQPIIGHLEQLSGYGVCNVWDLQASDVLLIQSYQMSTHAFR